MKEVIFGHKGPFRRFREMLRSIKENDAKLKESWRLTQSMFADCNDILESHGEKIQHARENEQLYLIGVRPTIILPIGDDDYETTEFSASFGEPENPYQVRISKQNDSGYIDIEVKKIPDRKQ